jgi:hypothetical protein
MPSNWKISVTQLDHRLVINVGKQACKVSAFCYSWPTHINDNGMYVCVLGIPKGKFSKEIKKKYLVFKFVMTGCDFVMTGCRNFALMLQSIDTVKNNSDFS